MPDQTGVGITLTVDEQSIKDAIDFQEKLESIDKNVQHISETFEKVNRSVSSFTGMMKEIPQISVKVDVFGDEAMRQMTQLIGLANQVNQAFDSVFNNPNRSGGSGGADSTREQKTSADKLKEQEDKLNQQLEAIWSKRADTYAALVQRIRDLNKVITGFNDIQSKGGVLSSKSVGNLDEATKGLALFEERLKEIRGVYNETKAASMVAFAVSMNESDYASAMEKLRTLKEAMKEVLLPGANQSQLGTQNRMLESLNEAIAITEDNIRNLGDDKQFGLGQKLQAALGLDESSVDNIKAKIKEVREAYQKLMSFDGGYEDIKIAWAEKLEGEIPRLEKLLKAKQELERRDKESAAANKMKSRLDESLDMDDLAVADLQRKIDSIRSSLDKLRNSSNPQINQSWIKQGEQDLAAYEKKLRDIQNTMSRTSEASQYLSSRLKQAFSIAVVTKFVQEVVRVRGEFEMMERSIAVIIKDEAKARDMFREIQQIAIKSPYQISDLAKQTKQLAAYRIETEKLVGTTKMLGDIASGTGVEINRLILAYGQVRAAQFLKGTELRQFSEAGVDLLGGLADRFSQIYQRAVSVGEVVQMISKKMVMFSDVEAVLTGMTSIGGTFYKMQEQQAETIQGMISNLKDRAEMMFNEVGGDFEVLIKGIIKLLQWVLDNAKLIEVTMLSFGAYKVVDALAISLAKLPQKFIESAAAGGLLSKKIMDTYFASKSAKAGLEKVNEVAIKIGKAAGYIGLAVAVVSALALVIKLASQEGRELNKVRKESEKTSREEIAVYTELTNTLKSETATYSEKKKALDDLKASYGNVLPLQNIELNNVSELNGKYSEHVRLLREYNAEKARQKQAQLLLDKVDDAKNADKVIDSMKRLLKNQSVLAKDSVSENVIYTAFNNVIDRIIGGDITREVDAKDELFKAIAKLEGLNAEQTEDFVKSLNATDLGAYNNQLTRIVDTFREYSSVLRRLNEEKRRFYIDVDLGESGEEIRQSIKGLKVAYDDFIRENAGLDEFKNNAAALRQAALESVSGMYTEIGGEITRQQNSGKISDTVAESLSNMLEKGLADLDFTGFRGAIEGRMRQINADPRFKEVAKFEIGVGITAINDNDTRESYTKSIGKTLDNMKASLKEISNTDIDSKKFQVVLEDFLATFMISDRFQQFLDDGMSESNALDRAIGLAKTQVKKLQEFYDSFAAESKKDRQNKAKEYSKNLAEFVRALRQAAADWRELDAQGQSIVKSQLSFKAHAVGIFDIPEINGQGDIATWIQTLLKNKTLQDDDKLSIDLEINKDNLSKEVEDAKEEIARRWENYDVAIKLKQFGLSAEGFDDSEILAGLKKLENDYRSKAGKGYQDIADEIARKMLEITNAQAEEAWKVMSEAAEKSQEKTVQEYDKMFKNIRTIREDANKGVVKLSQAQIDEKVQAEIVRAYKEITKAQWDAYKGTEMYIAAFGDLEGLGKSTLESLLGQLEGFAGAEGLNPTDAKAIADAIEKIKDAIAYKSGDGSGLFASLKSGLESIRKSRKEFDKLPDYVAKMNEADAALAKADSELKKAEKDYKNNPTPGNQDILTQKAKAYADAVEKASKATKDVKDAQENYNRSLETAKARLDLYQAGLDSAGNVMSGIIDLAKDTADAFGFKIDDDSLAVVESFEKAFGLLASAVGVASVALDAYSNLQKVVIGQTVTLEALLTPLLIAAAALGGIAAIVKAADNAKVRSIERHKAEVEGLQKAYEKLEQSIESAFTLREINTAFQEQIRNIQRQRAEIEQMIRTENSRGAKTDNDALKEYQEQLDELTQIEKEARDARLEALGAEADYSSSSKSFAQNWLSAFKEVGSGLDSLTGDFEDMFDSIIAGQLSTQVLGKYVEQLQEQIHSALENGEISTEESLGIQRLKESLAQAANAELTALAKALGVTTGTGGAETDNLQKGVESITEETASAIESYLNSMRFYVADSNEKVVQIATILSSSLETGANPMLNELHSQTMVLNRMYDWMTSITAINHSKVGNAIKVFAD